MDLDEYVAKRAELRKEAETNGRDIVVGLITEFMTKYPDVRGLSVTMYTPGFNDGDPCEFTVGEPKITFLDPTDVDESDDEVWYSGGLDTRFLREYYKSSPQFAQLIEASQTTLAKDLNKLSRDIERAEDLLEAAFGTDHELRAERRDGKIEISVLDYECGY